MINIILKEDKQNIDYDYIFKDLIEFKEKTKSIYKPILGIYNIGLYLKDIRDIKELLNNKNKYNHLNIDLLLEENIFKQITLAIPDLKTSENKNFMEYLIDGISKRNMIINKKVVYLMYNSIGKSFMEIDEILDKLYSIYGSFMEITDKDVSKYIIINDIVYPRNVLIAYINLDKYRKIKLEKCLSSISKDIVLASMVKQVKKLHEQKIKYLNTGLGNKFIKTLNTKNLNLMYYLLVTTKPYYLNDIIILLEIYERGLSLNDILY
jgi:hypothetical protein